MSKINITEQNGGWIFRTKKKKVDATNTKSTTKKNTKKHDAIHIKLTEKKTKVVLNEMLSWSGDSFNVLDEKSHVLYNIKGKLLSLLSPYHDTSFKPKISMSFRCPDLISISATPGSNSWNIIGNNSVLPSAFNT